MRHWLLIHCWHALSRSSESAENGAVASDISAQAGMVTKWCTCQKLSASAPHWRVLCCSAWRQTPRSPSYTCRGAERESRCSNLCNQVTTPITVNGDATMSATISTNSAAVGRMQPCMEIGKLLAMGQWPFDLSF